MQSFSSELFIKQECLLGEGVTWDFEAGQLLWVDILLSKVFCWSSSAGLSIWEGPKYCSTILSPGPKPGTVWLTAQEGIFSLNTSTGECELALELHLEPGFRTNDAGISNDNKLWLGTMHLRDPKSNPGEILVIDQSGNIKRHKQKMHIPNTFCPPNSSDNAMLVTDSLKGEMFRLELGSDAVEFAKTIEGETFDGGAKDADGNLWVAIWGAGRVDCLSPAGETIQFLSVGTPNVSNCCFGGELGQTLYITSAREGIAKSDLEYINDAGGLFCTELDVTGAPLSQFNL